MKRLILIAFMVVAPMAAITTTTGCRNQSAQTIAYKSLRSVAEGVDTGMKVFARAVVKGAIPEDTQLKVKSLHDSYQPIMEKAVVAARFDFSKPAPAELAELAGQLTEVIINAVNQR
ncbi:MAG: hypothetical protein H0U18_17725 [Pyrinomonadaceae bacterium]|nr:hypothetical protein [Pyrinomonadaceae bacterium]